MSRGTRIYSELGIYHIMFRGVNKQNIFEEDFDYKVMLDYIKTLKKKFSFEIYAYCLMSNHVHLILKENTMGEISLIMKNLLTKYAIYYNSKYDRRGHLFEDRYKSKAIIDNDYLFASIRYVHQNPVKAFIVESNEKYIWSSYCEYVYNLDELADKEYVFSILSPTQFKHMHSEDSDYCDPFDAKRYKVIELENYVRKIYHIEPEKIVELPSEEKREIILALKEKYSSPIIEEVTGINRRTVQRYK